MHGKRTRGNGRSTGEGIGRSAGIGDRNMLKSGRRLGSGSSGNCICLKCGYSVSKRAGAPCLQEKCPACGAALVRESGAHHQQAIKNKKKEV